MIIHDVVEDNVIQMVDRDVEVLKSKYLYSPIHYEGMERVEPLEIPEDGLPEGYTAEILMRKHSSRLRNKTIAAVMFRAGFIATWGRGYTKVCESFEAYDYPMPVVTEIDCGVSV